MRRYKLTEKSLLYDNLGPHEIDNEYAKTGMDEGWLSYQGYFRDSKNIVWHHYALRRTNGNV